MLERSFCRSLIHQALNCSLYFSFEKEDDLFPYFFPRKKYQEILRNRNARKTLLYGKLGWGAILSVKSQIASISDDLPQNRKSYTYFFQPTTAGGFGSGVFGMSPI